MGTVPTGITALTGIIVSAGISITTITTIILTMG